MPIIIGIFKPCDDRLGCTNAASEFLLRQTGGGTGGVNQPGRMLLGGFLCNAVTGLRVIPNQLVKNR